MSDLCAPVYIVTDADEEMTFWCFVAIMARMVRLPSLASEAHDIDQCPAETKLPARSKRHEEAAVHTAAAHTCHGP